MNKCKSWAAVLIAVLLLPNVAASADAAAEAFQKGLSYLDKEEYDTAIAAFTEAIRLNPKYFGVYESRGEAYENKGDYGKAIADFTEAIRLNPSFSLAY